MRAPSIHALPARGRRLVLLGTLLALALACGADLDDRDAGGIGGEGGGEEPLPILPHGGPLALAGPDQRVLPGMLVRLDGRGTVRPEDGRSHTLLWTQEAGPPVSLDDPNAPMVRFVAPAPIAQEGDRLVFRLQVDDGSRISTDRVAIRLVDDPEAILPAPIALGGADRETPRLTRIELDPPTFVDPACLEEGGDAACAALALPYCWTQVEGVPVELEDPCGPLPSFTTPSLTGVVGFRLDAHRSEGGANRSRLCGPEEALAPDLPFCASSDYVRFFVRNEISRTSPPVAQINPMNLPEDLPRFGPLIQVVRPSATYPALLALSASSADPSPQPELNTFYGFRPLLGDLPSGDLARSTFELPRDPGWPRTVALAFEAQFRRIRAAPAAIVVAWRPPNDRAPLIADAGPTPCGDAVSDRCEPVASGEIVTLRGEAKGLPSSDALAFCWEQIGGPAVALEPSSGCLDGIPDRSFEAPATTRPLDLAFRLTLRDQSALPGRPDAVVVRLRPAESQSPPLQLIAPSQLRVSALGVADASPTFAAAPDDRRLWIRWRQLRTKGTPPIELRQRADCAAAPAPAGSCVEFVAPASAAGKTIELEVLVSDEARLTSTRRVSIPVLE